MKILTIPLCLVLVFFAAPLAAATKPKPVVLDAQPSAPALIAQARAAATKGQTDLALRLAQSAIVAEPAKTDPYIVLGDVYAGAGMHDYARTYYEEALSIDPLEPAALKALAALDKRPSP